jgi:hypothetical protein
MIRSPARRSALVMAALLLGPLLLLASCGGVAACVGWWCVGVGPCYPYCYDTWDTAFGDFDGDGLVDTASGAPGGTMLVVRRGDAPGSLTDGQVLASAGGAGVDFVRAGQFSADANLDLVVVDSAAGEVRTRLGDGTGGFAVPGAAFALRTPAPLRRVQVASVDGDPFDDLVLFDFEGGIFVLLSDGAGGFTAGAAGRVAFGPGVVALAVGLLDGDAMVDIAILDADTRSLSVYTGTGTGGWTRSAGPFAIADLPSAAAIGEFNGLPGLDLAVVSGGDPHLRLFFGGGDGTLTPSAQGPLALGLSSVSHIRALPDVSAPAGPADLVVVGTVGFGGGSVLLGIPNLGAGVFGTPGARVPTPTVKDLLVIDLNADARMDLLLSYTEGSGVGIALGGPRAR